jgi:DNA-binding NarL/FixJ family response regulator
VLVLSPELDVRAQTAEVDGYLRALVPPDGDHRPVPAGAYNVAAQLLAVEAGVDDHPAVARVHLHGGRWVTLRAARVGDAQPSTGSDIAVAIEPSSPAERLGVFTRCHALTPRESEVVEHLARGEDTRTLAASLHLSEHTVQDHLKAIFEKTGCRSRRALLARASGY